MRPSLTLRARMVGRGYGPVTKQPFFAAARMSIIYRDRLATNRSRSRPEGTTAEKPGWKHREYAHFPTLAWLRDKSSFAGVALRGRTVRTQDAAGSATLEPLPPPAAVNPPETVTVDRLQIDEIRELTREGLDEQIITQMVRERGIARPLLVSDLVTLRRAGVSNELIKEIQKAAPRRGSMLRRRRLTCPSTRNLRRSLSEPYRGTTSVRVRSSTFGHPFIIIGRCRPIRGAVDA